MRERLRPECLKCQLKHLEEYPQEATVAQRLEYMQGVLKILAEAPIEVGAPVLSGKIKALQKELFGYETDYTEIKRYFNELMMQKVPECEQNLSQAPDSLLRAIQYSMVGNYIDFGAMAKVDETQLDSLLQNAGSYEVNTGEYKALLKDLQTAKRMVFITDNCGEIVLDKLLIQEIERRYPNLAITVLVRGEDVLNDATMTDAEQVGLPQIVQVMGNGSGIAGTCPDDISQEATVLLDEADVILAKGQANFETLRKCGKNIYYIFMCKCDMFAKMFGVPRFTGMLLNDRNCKE